MQHTRPWSHETKIKWKYFLKNGPCSCETVFGPCSCEIVLGYLFYARVLKLWRVKAMAFDIRPEKQILTLTTFLLGFEKEKHNSRYEFKIWKLFACPTWTSYTGFQPPSDMKMCWVLEAFSNKLTKQDLVPALSHCCQPSAWGGSSWWSVNVLHPLCLSRPWPVMPTIKRAPCMVLFSACCHSMFLRETSQVGQR